MLRSSYWVCACLAIAACGSNKKTGFASTGGDGTSASTSGATGGTTGTGSTGTASSGSTGAASSGSTGAASSGSSGTASSGTSTGSLPPVLQIEVESRGHRFANGETFAVPERLSPGGDEVVRVIIRNSGSTPLTIGTVLSSAQSNSAMSVRDAPAASIAAGDASVLSLVWSIGTDQAAMATGTVTIPSSDVNASDFVLTLEGTLVPVDDPILYAFENALYYVAADGSSLLPVYTSATIFSPATGLSTTVPFVNRGSYAMYSGQFASGTAPNDVFITPLPPAEPLAQNLTNLPAQTGQVELTAFGPDGAFYFTAAPDNTSPFHLYAEAFDPVQVKFADAVEVGGPLPAGPRLGVGDFAVSPLGDKIAVAVDADTASTFELYVSEAPFSDLLKVSAPLVAPRFVDLSSLHWADDTHLVYEARSISTGYDTDIFWVDIDHPPAVQINGARVANSHGVMASHTQVSVAGTHVYFLSDEATPNSYELYEVSTIGGAPSAAVPLNGGSAPGASGVDAFALDAPGDRVLFTAASGFAGTEELYFSALSNGAPTTSVVAAVPSVSHHGVVFDPAHAFLSDTRAYYWVDLQVKDRMDLFTLDLTATPITPTPIEGLGSFGITGVQKVLATADAANLVLMTDQTATTANFHTIYSSPADGSTAATLIGGGDTLECTGFSLLGQTVFFTHTAAPDKAPINLFTNQIGHSGETQLSGSEVESDEGVNVYEGITPTTAIYFVPKDTPPTELYSSSLGAAPVQLSDMTDSSRFASGEE